MLKQIDIDNFALIEKASISFSSGFCVITGETGSGKSILLNALGLILGERANFDVIGEHSSKAIVEATFDIENFKQESFFTDNDLDYHSETIIRREIVKSGKSRAFINDTPVTLSQLKQFVSSLVYIHSQNNTQELRSADFQMTILDVLSGNKESQQEYFNKYNAYKSKKIELEVLIEKQAQINQQLEFNEFQLNELNELNLENVSFTELQDKLNKAENIEEINTSFLNVIESISGEQGVVERLQGLQNSIKRVVSLDKTLSDVDSRLTEVIIELKDLSDTSENEAEELTGNKIDTTEIESILDKYNTVLLKHNLNNQDELKKLQSELENFSYSSDELKKQIEESQTEIKRLEEELYSLALLMHKARLGQAEKIEKSIEHKLDELKMSGTKIQFEMSKQNELGKYGYTNLKLLFAPNKGVSPVLVHQSASGGELSRLMLAIQSLISSKVQLQTVLFDEIDTGVSGVVASKVGAMLQSISKNMQVIAITHLPQVASKGTQHLKVSKSDSNGITTTFVKELTKDERIDEVAGLMSGEKVNAAAKETAKEMLFNEV